MVRWINWYKVKSHTQPPIDNPHTSQINPRPAYAQQQVDTCTCLIAKQNHTHINTDHRTHNSQVCELKPIRFH